MVDTHVLVIDDNPSFFRCLSRGLGRFGLTLHFAEDLESGLRLLHSRSFDVILLDLWLPGIRDLRGLDAVREAAPGTAVVVATGHGSIAVAVSCMQRGAVNVLAKPFEASSSVAAKLRAAAATSTRPRVRRLRGSEFSPDGILTASPKMQGLLVRTTRVADSHLPVLIVGETGTGKELVARRIHARSPWRGGPWVPVNCAALPEGLADAELFGHTRGAFTGAGRQRQGLLRAADGGTLFLDEVGELSSGTQARLLRTLQEGEVRPLGQSGYDKVQVRLVAASNRDLLDACARGSFREDLYHRLAGVVVTVPPLRQRQEDIVLLAMHFLETWAKKRGEPVLTVDPAAMACLLSYAWPGNVRELRNVVQGAAVVARAGRVELRHLPKSLRVSEPPRCVPACGSTLLEHERVAIATALREAGGNATVAATLLGVSRATLYRKLRRLDAMASCPAGSSPSP
jgi:DNA-binding NtrC family response regulator